jgi:hypothetical protein
LFSETALPSELSYLRQLDKDISLTPSSRESSVIGRFSGGSSILSNAALRSGEKYGTTFLFPPPDIFFRKNQRGDNYPDTGAISYLASSWIKLVRYTEAGYLPSDNNAPSARSGPSFLGLRTGCVTKEAS